MLLFTLLVLYHTIACEWLICNFTRTSCRAHTFAPVGMQNLFIINTALVQPVRRIILTLAILALF